MLVRVTGWRIDWSSEPSSNRNANSSVERPKSSGTTSAVAVNLKAWTPLMMYLTVRLHEVGSAHEKTMSKPADAPGGMTCEGGVVPCSSSSSPTTTSTRHAVRNSFITVKLRTTSVKTEICEIARGLGG